MFKFCKVLVSAMLVMITACSDEEKNPVQAENAKNEYVTNEVQPAVPVNVKEAVLTSADNSVVRNTFKIDVADTQEKLHRGLMGKVSIDDNYGLLFDINIVPKDTDVAFWMKDTLVALDMIFVDEIGKVFFIHKNAQPNDITPIVPPARPRAVLEVKAGQVDKYGIQVGDMLKADLIGNK